MRKNAAKMRIFSWVMVWAFMTCLFSGEVLAAEKTVKVGAIFPLSGGVAQTGVLIRAAMEIAQEIINTKVDDIEVPGAKTEGYPNLGAKLELVFMDSQNVPEKAMSAAEQLITQEGVAALLGCYTSATTATASQAAERLGIPFLNESSTSPILTNRGFQWFFRCTPDDDFFTRNFFEFLRDEEAKGKNYGRSIATLYENTLWGADVAKAVQKYAEQFGYKIVADVPYTAKSASLTSEVQQLKSANADIVMLASYVSDAILLQTTFRDLDYSPKIILAHDAGFNDPNFLATVGSAGNYILSREVYASTLLNKPSVKKLNERMVAKTGFPLDGNSARGLMGVLVISDVLLRAKSTSPEDIQQALLETDIPAEQVIFPWLGVKFDQETHQINTGRGIVVQIQDQKYVPVWPYEIAGAEVLYPIPAWKDR
ncbi:MAG: ABC transporter substrate-binding protein [Synergistaceae bacterium]|jgi:branched-chain amino acid transport system substrate-binding protein|nr:ABC transporter substrate-binding protein [Synergistaceae bacterium]